MTTLSPSLTSRKALEEWLLDFHKSSATLDAKLCADKFFTRDVEMCYANNPPVNGKASVEAFFDKAFKALDLMHHDINYFDFVGPDKLYQGATIKYLVKGDDPDKDLIVIPAIQVAWLKEEEGKLKMWRSEIYLDACQVFAKMSEKGLL